MPHRPSRVSQVSIKIGDIERAIPVKDGGKAWLLVLGAFVCQMLCAGLVQGMGVTFVELQNYFGASATDISWIGSCLTFSACSISVVSGALSRQIGCRPVVVCGGLLASLSMIAASFSEELWHLYITISLTGFGCGLALPAAISVIGFNFQVHFGIANGLQYAGVGVGIMSIPPLFQFLFELYTWQGALLIYGTVLLNVCACGLLMKPGPAEIYSLKNKASKYSSVPASGNESGIQKPVSSVLKSDRTTERSVQLYNEVNDDVFESKSSDSANPGAPADSLGQKAEEAYNQSSPTRRQSSVRFEVDTTSTFTELPCEGLPIEEDVTDRQPAKHKCLSNIAKSFREAASIVGVNILWKHPNFACFALAVMMFGFGYSSCLYYFIPRAIQDLGIPELKASLLMTVLGVCSLTARLTNGLVVDLGIITPLKFFCLSCLVCSVSSFITPFTHSMVGSFVCAGLFGLASGVANPMLAMVSRELVGQKVMASALGILMLFNGMGSVAGIFTMGYVFDHYGNYSISFYIAGCDLLLIIFVVFLGKALTKKLPSSRRASRNSSVIKDESLDTPKKSPQRHSIKEEDTKTDQSVPPSNTTVSCMESSV